MTDSCQFELSNCPHCGSRAQSNWRLIGEHIRHFVQCLKCGSKGGESRDKQVSIELWEERT